MLRNKNYFHFLESVPKSALVIMDEAYYEYAEAEDYPQTLPLLEKV